MAGKSSNNAKPQLKKARRPSRGSGASGLVFVMAGLGGFAVISPGAVGAILLCMLPTFVLLFGDSDGLQKMRAQCVGYLNAAAAFPYVINIYNEKTTFLSEVMDMRIFLVTWGAALIGTFLQYAAPVIAAQFLQIIADEKLNKIKNLKEKLVNEWGPEVTGAKDVDIDL